MFKPLGFFQMLFAPDEPQGGQNEFDIDVALNTLRDDPSLTEFFPAGDTPPAEPAQVTTQQQATGDGQRTQPPSQPPTGPTSATGTQPPQQPPVQTAPPPQQDFVPRSDLEDTRRQLQALQQNFNSLLQGMGGQQRAPEPTQQQEQLQLVADQAIADNLVADDPNVRRAAAQQLMEHTSNYTLAVMERVGYEMIANAVPRIVQHMNNVAAQQRQIHDAFYQQFPAFARSPELKRIAAVAASHVAQSEGGFVGMTPDFAKKVVVRAFELLGIPGGQIPTPQQQAAARPTHPALTRNSARPNGGIGNGAPDPNSPEGIIDLLTL